MAEKRKLANQGGTVSTTSVKILDYFTNRSYLLVQNKSETAKLYLSFGKAATVDNGIMIAPGTAYEPPFEVMSEVHIISDEADTDYVYIINDTPQMDPLTNITETTEMSTHG